MFPSLAHGLANGAVAVSPGIFLGLALLSVACVALADRRRSWHEIGFILLIAQPTFHVLLSVGSQHHHTALAPSPGMVLAHGCAIVVLTTILTGAETVAWSLAALRETVLLTRLHLLFGATPAAPPTSSRRPLFVNTLRSWSTVLLASSAPRRGPPLACMSS